MAIRRSKKNHPNKKTSMIHAELSPQAKAHLKAIRRNSTIASVVIAFLIVALLLIVLGFFFMKPMLVQHEFPTVYISPGVIETPPSVKVVNLSRQKPTRPTSAGAKIIVANTSANFAIPVPEVDTVTPTSVVGVGDDFDQGIFTDNEGDGPGGMHRSIPYEVSQRCSKQDRLNRLDQTGGTEQCEEAVLKALRWMKQTQSADGSWNGQRRSAMTGLGLLAYLGHCETPMSEEFGESCLKAITYLINLSMKNDGKLADDLGNKHWPYEHAICVYALAEATTFCQSLKITVPNLAEATQKSGQLLINSQHKSGGWDYAYDESGARGGDVSIAGWHIQALKAMKHTGLDFKNLTHSAKKGLAYLETKQDANGGFGYTSKKSLHSYYTLTGVGVLCFQMWDKGTASEARKGANYIEENTKLKWGTPDCDLYAHYYESQAMMNRGGKQWNHYNAIMRDEVLKNQRPDGTWLSTGHGAGVFYHTALCTLMLEVYYRFLPGTGAGPN